MNQLSVVGQHNQRDQREKELKILVEEKIEYIERRGLLEKMRVGIRKQFFKNPLLEIYYDWCTVYGFADKVKESILTSKNEVDSQTKNRYATAQAYLELAKYERNPGKAWNHVNSADKLLPLLVNGKDFSRCLKRLRGWDKRLCKLEKGIEEQINELNNKYKAEHELLSKEYNANFKELDEKLKAGTNNDSSKVYIPIRLRIIEYYKQAFRAQRWFSVNRELSLKYYHWRSYTHTLLLVLIPAIIISEILYMGYNPDKPAWYFPFFYISIIGLFGGGLSARLIVRDPVKRATSAELIKVLRSTRILIGAVGAFTVYATLGSGFIAGEYSQMLHGNAFSFITIGITAGFSEQLFVDSLDKSAAHLDIIGKTTYTEKE